MNEKEIKRNRIKKLKRRVRLRTILFLALAISCNSFAWFVYNSKVSNSIVTHIKAWKVVFENEDNQLTEEVKFTIDQIYPGMDNYTDSISIANKGEADATLHYEIVSVRILNNVIIQDNNHTSESLINSLANDYPFKINFLIDNPIIAAGGGESTFKVNVNWAYDSGNDSADTYWGNESYKFIKENENNGLTEVQHPEIELVIRLYATQNS